MATGFIASLIARWRRPGNRQEETAAQAAALRAPLAATAAEEQCKARENANVRKVTTFWQAAVAFVPLNDLIEKYAKAPEITLREAAVGQLGKKRTMPAAEGEDEENKAGREVLVVLGLALENWQRRPNRKARYVLAIPGRLTPQGDLMPLAHGGVPFFNPAYVQAGDLANDIFLTATAAVRSWVDGHAPPLLQEWGPLWAYALLMLRGALFEPQEHLEGAKEWIAKSLSLLGPQEWIVKVMPAAASNAATREIERVYQHLLDDEEQTSGDDACYRRLVTGCAGNPFLTGAAADRADRQQLGHMDAFKEAGEEKQQTQSGTRNLLPLDASQRQVVRHVLALEVGHILAVNGPPGTGKTATLRAVIASHMVGAALEGGRPRIIVGCGATNQSVTNITKAFIEAAHHGDDYPLARRWNPYVSSYGMFWVSKSYAEAHPEEVRKYQGLRLGDPAKERCLFSLREGRNPFAPAELAEMEAYYLEQAKTCAEITAIDVTGIVAELQVLLRETAIDLPNRLRQLSADAVRGKHYDLAADAGMQKRLQPLIDRQNDRVRRELFPLFVAWLTSANPGQLAAIMADAECDAAEASRLLTESVIDASFRPHAFHVAARYWEGRFLGETERLHSRLEENVQIALERIAMLAPCIVSTVNSLPGLFSVRENESGVQRHFAYGLADLLVMDESGQALPEVGAACFALAKRALVVGDLQQLAPVSSLQPVNELAILAQHSDAANYDDLVDHCQAPSSGSVLGMAQRASSYHDRFGGGLTLLYHYRCVQPIIGFCNRLSYGGHLKIKTSDGAGQWPPPLAWVEIAAKAAPRGRSWVNREEAKEIASWLRSAWPRIRAGIGAGQTIDQCIAVLSAFRPQIEALREEIEVAFSTMPENLLAGTAWPRQEDIARMTIGTVHALQGAERPIVIFSATAAAENTATPFFNTTPSLLNVAASRAQKSFLYFGDPGLLFQLKGDEAPGAGSPSAILGDYMHKHPMGRQLYPLYLVIVEAPGKCEAIEAILGKDYRIVAMGGGIREIDAGDHGLGFDRGLRPRWRWREGRGKLSFAAFTALARSIDRYEAVYIATDADIEGEAIAWHVMDAFAAIVGSWVWNRIKRVRLGDITRAAVEAAFDNPGTIDRNLATAALARAIADRLIAIRLAKDMERAPTSAEAAKEAEMIASLKSVTKATGKAAREPFRPGRVQAGTLRLVHDQVLRELAASAAAGRFRVVARVPVGKHVLRGTIVLPQGEYRIATAGKKEALQIFLDNLSPKLPAMLEHYEHGGLEEIDHLVGPEPLLSTIEAMRRGLRRGLLPWETMAALESLYLGVPQVEGYFGEEDGDEQR